MKINSLPLLPALLAASLLWTAGAAAQSPPPARKPDPRAEIARKLEVPPDAVRPATVPGLFEVADGADIGYVSADGRYYIAGDLFDLDTRRNLTEQRRQGTRVALLAGVPDAQAIVFAPKAPKYTLTVFTDIDCGYCRKLHSEIGELNKRGVKVRYLLYPRGGPGSESWKKAEAVWCSANRNDALTRAKLGENVTARACNTPVSRQYQLGRDMGLRGTPAMVTGEGQMIGGYLPADRLVEHLEELRAEAAR